MDIQSLVGFSKVYPDDRPGLRVKPHGGMQHHHQWLYSAIAKEFCRRLHKTRYVRMPKLLEEFNLATQTGAGISKLVKRYSTYHMLIIDEWLVEIPSEMEGKRLNFRRFDSNI